MMDEFIRKQNDYCGVTAWNEAGWTGKGVTVWDLEPLNTHGTMTMQRIIHAAPEAKVLNYGHSMRASAAGIEYEYVKLEDGTKVSSDEFVRKNHVTIFSHSHSGHNNNKKHILDLYGNLKKKYNLALFNSAGNAGEAGARGAIPESLAIYVGAAIVFKHDFNDIRMASYSSMGDEIEEVDFTTFVGSAGWSGTSFACPYLAGMAALLQQRYGFDMTQDEIYAYFKMCAKPIDAGHPSKVEGYDYWSGWGMPILPEPKKRLIRMTIGSKFYKVDGETRTMDTAPFIYQQRTFVPIAFIALALGASVRWNPQEQEVVISKGGRILSMRIGRREYMLNGKPYQMDTVPFIRDQRTQVPISFVSLALGCKVAWVEKEKKVLVLE